MFTELVMTAAEFAQAHQAGLQLGVTALRLAIEVARGIRWMVRRRDGRTA
jgi:hypothetical protein